MTITLEQRTYARLAIGIMAYALYMALEPAHKRLAQLARPRLTEERSPRMLAT